MKKDEEITSEVQEEMRLYIYCWNEVPMLASENFVRSEIRKMDELIKLQLKDFNQKQKHKLKSKIL